MHRFFLPPNLVVQPELTLDARESHHAVNVLRIREGERVVVLDGAGIECLCEVIAADNKAVQSSLASTSITNPTTRY